MHRATAPGPGIVVSTPAPPGLHAVAFGSKQLEAPVAKREGIQSAQHCAQASRTILVIERANPADPVNPLLCGADGSGTLPLGSAMRVPPEE